MNYNEFIQRAVIASLPSGWPVTMESPTTNDMLDAAKSAADLLVENGLLEPQSPHTKISRGLPVIDFIEDDPATLYTFDQRWDEDSDLGWVSGGWWDADNNPVEIEGFEMYEAIEWDKYRHVIKATFAKKP